VSDVPSFVVCPPLRCCRQLIDSPLSTCGSDAQWQRPGKAGQAPQYFCSQHRGKDDVPIAGPRLIRLVRLQVEVLYAGTSSVPAIAHAEALAQLESAVTASRGMLSINAATSVVGRYEPQPPPPKHAGGRPKAL